MSDHDWTCEHIAVYVMGGLSVDEMDRIDRHARVCAECAAALSAERRMDRRLGALFADVLPGASLETTAVTSLRKVRRWRPEFGSWMPRAALAAGVLLVLASVGAMVGALVGDGDLPMPGSVRKPPESTAQILIVKNSAGSGGTVAITTDDSASMQTGDETKAQVKGVIAGKEESIDLKLLSKLAAGQNFTPSANPTNGQGSGGIYGIGGIGGQHGIGGGFTGFSGGISGIGGGGGIANLDSTTLNSLGYYQPARALVVRDYASPKNTSEQVPPASVNGFKPSEHRLALTQSTSGKGERDAETTAQRVLAVRSDGQPAAPAPEPNVEPRRIIVRSGDMEFEVKSFDDAVNVVTKLLPTMPGAFVDTVNSEKLPNGKVRGSIKVRTPPERLDRLVSDLRRELGAIGDLKGMKVNSQDITKQYVDLESRLRGARTMEQRLLDIIKNGKGEIKQLLEAERELGVWRTKVEEFEGELRYYSNLAALSTLTIALAEKEIRAAASVTETEQVQAGVEVEDVDKAYQQTIAAVTEAKGRLTKAELKQVSAGQFNASLQFEVPQEGAGPIRDRLRQLGRVARLQIDRVQKASDGTPALDARVKRGDTLFIVQLYNLANIAARETTAMQLAATDVRLAYQSLRDAAAKANGRVFTSQLNEQDPQNVTAQLDVEVRRPEEGAFRAALDGAGEVIARQVARAPESDETTDTKVLFRMVLMPASRLSPRETTTMTVEAADVDQASSALSGLVAEAKGRQLNAQSSRDPSGKASAKLTFEIPLATGPVITERFKSAGTVRSQQTTRDAQAPAGKFATARFDVTLVSRDQIVSADDGLWPQIRRGLSYSVSVLLTSVTWVVFGLCVVLPWCVLGYVGYRLVRRLRAA